MKKPTKKVGRPSTGTTPLRQIRIKRWEEIPAKNKSKFINDLIDDALGPRKKRN